MQDRTCKILTHRALKATTLEVRSKRLTHLHYIPLLIEFKNYEKIMKMLDVVQLHIYLAKKRIIYGMCIRCMYLSVYTHILSL